ncbi:MAG: DUF3352 domain-containing protein [Chloroflexota bacterium]|jgi:hypothetical protein
MTAPEERQDHRFFGRRTLLAAGVALLGILLVAAVLLLVDPFGWNLFDKASGLRDEAAAAMPPDVGLYAGLDLVNFSEETLTAFSQPFVTALAEPGVDDLAGGLDRLDAMLAQEIGLTLGDDVMPWLGRSVGLGLTGLEARPDGRIDRAGWLLVAGTQDRAAADEFLAELTRAVSERSGLAPSTSRYRRRTITSFGPDERVPLGGLAFTRSAGQLIVGDGETAVRAAVDAQLGDSLAGDQAFQSLRDSLPDGRGLTLYVDQAQLPQLNRLMAAAVPLAIGPLDLSGMLLPPGAIGVSIVDQGLRLDTASLATDQATGSTSPRQMAGLFPDSTLAFVSGDSLAAAWQSMKASLAAGGSAADFDESIALLDREFGFNPDRALLPALDGEWVLALLPADEGLVPALTGQPLGAVLLAGGNDEAALSAAVADLSQALAGQRLPLATVEVGGVAATFVDLESLVGVPLPLYGLDDGFLFVATSAQVLGQVLRADSALTGDPDYAAAVALLPDEFQTTAYLDMPGLRGRLDGLAGGSSAALLEPVQGIVAASGPAANGVQTGVVFVIVD